MGANMTKMLFPKPGGDGGTIAKIVKIIKTIIGIFKKPSKEAGETDSINDQSSLENIDRIVGIFSDFKEQVHVKAVEIERAVEEEVNYYTEELHDILTENADKVDKYGIRTKRIERQIDRISLRLKGIIDNELSKKVSLDNSECKEIVKMIPGTKKEAEMNSFLSSAMKTALEACCNEMHSSLDDIYEDAESEIVGTVESIQNQNEHLQESLLAIDEDNYEMTAKKQMVDAYYIVDACDIVLEIL